MKKIIALILALMLFLTGCGSNFDGENGDGFFNESTDVESNENLPEDSGTNDPEVKDPEINDPEVKDPEVNDPEVKDPEVNDPEINDPEVNDPEVNDPEVNDPEVNDPEVNDPEVNDPEVNDPEVNDPEVKDPEVNDPEVKDPEVNDPEVNDPEVKDPEVNDPEVKDPEVKDPEVKDPETNEPEIKHNYQSTVIAPTCDKAGYTTYTCTICGDSYVANQVSALGHKYNSTEIAASCEAEGYTIYTCTVCGDNYKANVVAALGHKWKEATTEAPKTCTTCGVIEGDKLPSTTPDSGNTSGSYADTLYVTYINVGQGDSIFIKVGDCDILIDAGTSSYGSTVSNYLKNQGVDDIELVINTHPDADHCGGLSQVFKDHVVEEVWISKDTSKSTTAYKNFTSAITSEGLTAKKPNAGTVFTYEYLTMTVLYSAVGSDSNNSSIVVMLEYGSFRFLFTGDIGEEVEKKLVDSSADLKCDVLKVGHHGSAGSSSASFLTAVGAEYGVICVGSNSYGHPTSETLSRLSSAGVSVYRTDKNGNVVFSTNGATLTLPGGGTDSTGSGAGVVSGGTSSGGSSSGSSSSGSSSGGTSSSDVFIGNTETKVFHLPTCSNLPAASKQNTMYNYWWIINIAGYTPCGRCLKNYSSSGTTYIANSDTKVYHVSSCSYLPGSANRIYIQNTSGYTPCGHCISSSTKTSFIVNTESKVYHLSTCSYLPAASKQMVVYNTSGYTPCGHCIK